VNKGSADGNQGEDITNKVISLAEKNPELVNRALDVLSQYAPTQTQQGGAQNPYQIQNSPYPPQAQEPQAKKTLKRGISTQSKIMMGVGALMLMLVLGPMIFPAIAGMGAMGSALMAGAGAGLLAYGASKAGEDRDPPSTGYSNRIQPTPNQAVDQMGNAMGMAQQQQRSQSHDRGQGQNSSESQPPGQQDLDNALKEARQSGAVDGVKSNEKIIKEVDDERNKLMEKLALPDGLKRMVNTNATDLPSFDTSFDAYLKETFFANMGEKDTGRSDAGMGREFLSKVNQKGSEENKAFEEFKDNMKVLLKKDQEHYQSPQAHDALIAEKSALTTAIDKIEGLKAGNKLSKESLDKSGMIMVEKGQKDKVDEVRLGNLVEANKKIGSAKQNFESKKLEAKSSIAASQPSSAPAPSQAQNR
jgi:hypothetical protein